MAPSQLWLKTFKINVFRDRQSSVCWAACPTRLPCTSAEGEELEPSALGRRLGALGI